MLPRLVRPVAPGLVRGEFVGAGAKADLWQPLHGQGVEGAVAFQRFLYGSTAALFRSRRADGLLVVVGGVEAEDGIAVGGFDLVSVNVVIWMSKF